MAERLAVRVVMAVPRAMPAVRTAASRAALDRPPSAETREGVGDRFGWIDVVGGHRKILHAT
jgi:hypothetical protein